MEFLAIGVHTHIGQEWWLGSFSWATYYIQYDDSEAVDVAFQCQVSLHCVLWSSIPPLIWLTKIRQLKFLGKNGRHVHDVAKLIEQFASKN